MATPTKTYLIIGATGTQGSSVIKALLATPTTTDFKILALTRDITSKRAQSLASLSPKIRLLQGDPTAPEAIFSTANTHIDSLFCVTVHGPPGSEESQASGLITAALSHAVSHFVFTSADRGGDIISDTTPTPAAHIASKYRIELELKRRCEGTSMKWTILRPVTFMDNLTPDFAGKGFAAMWRQVGAKPIQLVAASDIGAFGAKALLEPERFVGQSVGIAGDSLNFEEASERFKEVIGVEMPTTFCAVGSVLRLAMKDIGVMFKWFETGGYGVDIEKARREVPELMDFGTWLEKSSGFREYKTVKHV